MLTDDPYLHISLFGRPVSVGGVSLTGVFSDRSIEALGMAGDAPTLRVVTSQLPLGTDYGTAVQIGADAYTVAAVKHDGTGASTLQLREV